LFFFFKNHKKKIKKKRRKEEERGSERPIFRWCSPQQTLGFLSSSPCFFFFYFSLFEISKKNLNSHFASQWSLSKFVSTLKIRGNFINSTSFSSSSSPLNLIYCSLIQKKKKWSKNSYDYWLSFWLNRTIIC